LGETYSRISQQERVSSISTDLFHTPLKNYLAIDFIPCYFILTMRKTSLSVKQFAKEMKVSQRTVFTWLRGGLIPKAKKTDLPNGISYWEIPRSALKIVPPKRGPKEGKGEK
jgi:DNA-binding transcriptional regulator YiaG